MKKLLMMLCIGALLHVGSLFSQNFLGSGGNGTNFFDSMTKEELEWLKDWIPEDSTLVFRLRLDNKEDNKDLLFQNLAIFDHYMDSCHRNIDYIVTVSTYNTAAVVMEDLNYLESEGITPICVELDNEPYAGEKYNFNFLAYQDDFEPIKESVLDKWPNMPIAVFLAPRAKDSGVNGGRNDHKTFNDAAISYIASEPANICPAIHIYINEKEISALATPITKRLIFSSTYDAGLEANCQTFLDPVYNGTALSLYDSSISYVRKRLPGRTIYVTEFQYNNSSSYKNTMWNSIATFIMWHKVKNYENTYFLEHMLKGNTTAGNISKVDDRYDLYQPGAASLRRTNYWVYQLFRKYPLNVDRLGTQFIESDSTYIFWFVNNSDSYIPYLNFTGLAEIESVKVEYLSGNYLYSSAGVIEPMAKGSEKTYEIQGTQISYDYMIPANSLGYITLEVKASCIYGCTDTSYLEYNELANCNEGCINKKVYGCTDETYLEYNPDANFNQGCITKKVYGCMDKSASNYNPKANVDNGTCCYRKWWQIFKKCPKTAIAVNPTTHY